MTDLLLLYTVSDSILHVPHEAIHTYHLQLTKLFMQKELLSPDIILLSLPG